MRARKLITATLLGVMVFLIKGPLLAPYADLLVIFEALLVGIGFALLGRGGATYVELVNGALLTVYEASSVPALAPFVLPLALLFGASVDLAGGLLKARVGSEVRAKRLAAAVTIAAGVTGVIAYLATVPTLIALGFLPNDQSMVLVLGIAIIVIGVAEGAVGGYLAARIWEMNLKARFKSFQPPLS